VVCLIGKDAAEVLMHQAEGTEWGIGRRAEQLHSNALVWDCHAGDSFDPQCDLRADMEHWHKAGVNFLSVNVGYDVPPFSGLAIEALANYRRQIRDNSDLLVLAETVEDVRAAKAQGKLALAFDLEGTDALKGDIGMVEVFHRLGVRQMLFAYNRNNRAGGGCHDEDRGLTDFGRELVREMNRVGMVVDCSHCGFKTTMEAMELSAAPVIFSHSNARALRDHERNIRDEQILACGQTGGVVGVTGVKWFLKPQGAELEDLLRQIDYMTERIGPDHVGIGLDAVLHTSGLGTALPRNRNYWPENQYPNAVSEFFLPEIFPQLTQGLLDRGYSEADIQGILGDNFRRLAENVWN
jgi:membrane dipeptidase